MLQKGGQSRSAMLASNPVKITGNKKPSREKNNVKDSLYFSTTQVYIVALIVSFIVG